MTIGMNNSSAANLWAHITQKSAPGSEKPPASSFLPPTGPQDKNATTMRVLLHDTQMNLEMFSGNVERLLKRAQETERGLKTTASLFEKEHDKLMGDIIDLVNRAQTQIQKSIGEPAQTSVVDALHKNVEKRLESIDLRLDAIQAFNQTHSQALQTQIQAIQTLQTQQNAMAASIAPLLPLLQTVASRQPSHDRTVKSTRKAAERSSPAISIHSSTSGGSPKSHKKRARSSSDAHSSSSVSAPLCSRKKSRIDTSPLDPGRGDVSVLTSKSPEIVRGLESEGKAPQTPRRPLQEIYIQSPRLAATPRDVQQAAGGPTSDLFMQSRPSKPSVSYSKHDDVVTKLLARNLSLKGKVDPSNNNRRNIPAQTPIRNGPQTGSTLTNVSGSANRYLQSSMLPPPGPISAAATPGQPRIYMGSMMTPHRAPQTAPRQLHTAPSFLGGRLKEPIPMKEGKRFIPLVDTDEEDED